MIGLEYISYFFYNNLKQKLPLNGNKSIFSFSRRTINKRTHIFILRQISKHNHQIFT